MLRSKKLAWLALTPLAASISLATAAAEHKVLIPKGEGVPVGYQKLADYGSFALYRSDKDIAPGMMSKMLDNANMLLFDRQPFDTQTDAMRPPIGFSLASSQIAGLHLVQFVGPMKDDWLAEITRQGAVPIHYIANNGYLVWADANTRAALGAIVGRQDFLQYSQPLPSYLKLGDTLANAFATNRPLTDLVTVTVQRYRHDTGTSNNRFKALGLKSDTEWSPVLEFENARYTLTLAQVRQVAEFPDVFWVGEVKERELFDEVQAQIIRGFLTPDRTGPVSEGYKGWLESLGFPTTPSSYSIVDVTDDGIGNMTTTPPDPTFYLNGSTSNPTRLAYVQNCNGGTATVGVHGHINTNIVGGYDTRDNGTAAGARFPGNYQRGQGMNPFGRMGGTRVFAPSFGQANCGNSDQGVIAAVQNQGATISSNSWGCGGCAGTYDDSSQAYDVGVRDADSGEAGNQQIVFLFAAGNDGPGASSIGTPGNGKNMITVGASENKRETDENGNWTDGCSVGPTGANSAMDVIDFSSRGPAPGNRRKPEVIAPGTHITGTKPVPNSGSGACDVSRPTGNATYAASSGTSHSTPAVAGVVSLVDYWITNDQGNIRFDGDVASKPAPATIKAWLMAHPTYLTGVDGNDTLPSNNQGYGMPNMDAMFNDEPKYVLNQTRVLGATGESFTINASAQNTARPVRIAMAYTDKAGAIGTSPQVNNLNLVVIADGQTYRGNAFTGQFSNTTGAADSLNNYEAVFLPAGAASSLEIRVEGANIADDGVPGNADTTDQDFALVCDNCGFGPTFALGADAVDFTVCTTVTNSVTSNLTVSSIEGFVTPVTLSMTGTPAGSTTNFSTNPVTPTGTSALTIGNLSSIAAGVSNMTLSATSGAITKPRAMSLTAFTQPAGSPTLTAPASGALNVPLRPTFTWTAGTQAANYVIEVDNDADFSSILYTSPVSGTSHTPGVDLPSNTALNWRVRATNICGANTSTAQAFSTVALPGDCATGTTAQVHYQTGFEAADPNDWTLGAGSTGTANWATTTARVRSGTQAFLAQDLAAVSDQRLVSPAVTLPTGQNPVALIYYSHQILEDQTAGGCFDAGILEISTDDGATFTQVPGTALQTDPYNGAISTQWSNPLAGASGWCEDPATTAPPVWTQSVVDLNAFAGQSVRFRFRVATDSSLGRVPHGFYLDDVRVQSCQVDGPATGIFSNSFE